MVLRSSTDEDGRKELNMENNLIMNLNEKLRYREKIEEIVKGVGEYLLTKRESEIADTHDYKGHESSSIDACAREKMQVLIDQFLPDFEGIVRFELRPYIKKLIEKNEHRHMVLIADEIEGTTNTKRCLSATLDSKPAAVISLALSLTESLEHLVVGAIYTLDQGEVFSAIKTEDRFLSFRNSKLINHDEVVHRKGDSRWRVMVVGYSNSHRLKKAEVEQAIYDKAIKVYEGCRASGMDIINIIRNLFDAYVDLRSYWSTKKEGKENEAMLQVYDIAGVIPIAEGCGLKVTDAEGKPWTSYRIEDTIPLIVSRPELHPMLLDLIQPLIEKWK